MGAERRRSPRRLFAGGHLPPAARLKPGGLVTLVNLSASGALIESRLRLRPGSRCELRVGAHEDDVVAIARVVRSFVARLDASSVRYRAALAFDAPIDTPPEQQLLAEYQLLTVFPSISGRGVAASRHTAGIVSSGPPFRGERRT